MCHSEQATKIDDGGAAFPSEYEGTGGHVWRETGMSLRDYLALRIFQVLVPALAEVECAPRGRGSTHVLTPLASAIDNAAKECNSETQDEVADMSFDYADAWLRARAVKAAGGAQ